MRESSCQGPWQAQHAHFLKHPHLPLECGKVDGNTSQASLRKWGRLIPGMAGSSVEGCHQGSGLFHPQLCWNQPGNPVTRACLSQQAGRTLGIQLVFPGQGWGTLISREWRGKTSPLPKATCGLSGNTDPWDPAGGASLGHQGWHCGSGRAKPTDVPFWGPPGATMSSHSAWLWRVNKQATDCLCGGQACSTNMAFETKIIESRLRFMGRDRCPQQGYPLCGSQQPLAFLKENIAYQLS